MSALRYPWVDAWRNRSGSMGMLSDKVLPPMKEPETVLPKELLVHAVKIEPEKIEAEVTQIVEANRQRPKNTSFETLFVGANAASDWNFNLGAQMSAFAGLGTR